MSIILPEQFFSIKNATQKFIKYGKFVFTTIPVNYNIKANITSFQPSLHFIYPCLLTYKKRLINNKPFFNNNKNLSNQKMAERNEKL